MPSRTRLSPADHGREIDPDDFEHSDCDPDYRAEIIDGRVFITPRHECPQDCLAEWLFEQLLRYVGPGRDSPASVSCKARVFVHSRPQATRVEPDLALYLDSPPRREWRHLNWPDLSPTVVAEVPTPGDPEKDLVRNVALYLDVPSVREYWILDPHLDPDAPALRVYRRRGKAWQKPIDVPFGGVYETPRLLPGFRLVVDPDR